MADDDLDAMLRRMAATKINRRGFLWAAGLAGGAAAIAACTPAASGPPSPPAATSARSAASSDAAPSASASASTAANVEVENELFMYNWGDYVDPTNMQAFQDQYHVDKFTYDTFASNDEMMAKFQGGAKGQWDLSAPTANYIPAMRDQGFIQKLDLSLIPNVSLIEDTFKKQWWDPTDEWQVPKDWGTTGISLRTKIVKEDVR